jgi:hypothetical protein
VSSCVGLARSLLERLGKRRCCWTSSLGGRRQIAIGSRVAKLRAATPGRCRVVRPTLDWLQQTG